MAPACHSDPRPPPARQALVPVRAPHAGLISALDAQPPQGRPLHLQLPLGAQPPLRGPFPFPQPLPPSAPRPSPGRWPPQPPPPRPPGRKVQHLCCLLLQPSPPYWRCKQRLPLLLPLQHPPRSPRNLLRCCRAQHPEAAVTAAPWQALLAVSPARRSSPAPAPFPPAPRSLAGPPGPWWSMRVLPHSRACTWPSWPQPMMRRWAR